MPPWFDFEFILVLSQFQVRNQIVTYDMKLLPGMVKMRTGPVATDLLTLCLTFGCIVGIVRNDSLVFVKFYVVLFVTLVYGIVGEKVEIVNVN